MAQNSEHAPTVRRDSSQSLSPSPSSESSFNGITGKPRADTPSPTLTVSDSRERRVSISRRSSRSLSFDIWDKLPEEVLLPRSDWLAKVMHKHPEILEWRELTRGFYNLPSFGRLSNAGKTEVRDTLSHSVVLQLIYQYLKEEQLYETLKLLEDETGEKCYETDLDDGALVMLLRMSVRDLNNLFGESDIVETVEDPEIPANEDLYSRRKDLESDLAADEVPIWEEYTDNSDTALIYDGIIEAGTLNRLILWLFNPNHSEKEYKRFFVLSYSSFVTADKLLNKLIQLYSKDANTASQVILFFKYWIEVEPQDFLQNEALLSNLNKFIDNRMVKDKQFHLIKQLRNVVSKLESVPEIGVISERKYSDKPPEPKVPRNIFSPTLTLDDVDEEEIARQLSIIDFRFYQKIKASELFSKNWSAAPHPSRTNRINNIKQRFSEVVRWVSTEILFAQKPRVVVITRFLKIAEHLFQLNNFNTLMAIYTGLVCTTTAKVLHFIKRDLARPQQEVLRELHLLLNVDNNYQNYRAALASTVLTSCVPVIGVLLKDLTFFEEAYPDKFKQLINFSKRRYQCELILDQLRFQLYPYNYQYVHQISVLLLNLRCASDRELEEKASILELSYENS